MLQLNFVETKLDVECYNYVYFTLCVDKYMKSQQVLLAGTWKRGGNNYVGNLY